MKIHEYQAKALFLQYKIPVPIGHIAFNSREAVDIIKKKHKIPVVIKAQIHAGGRGKAGGVKMIESLKNVDFIVDNMIGKKIATCQTGSSGKKVTKVLIEQVFDISKELYLSMLPDRSNENIVIIASEIGGVNIEKVAEESSDKIVRINVNPILGFKNYHYQQLVYELKIPTLIQKHFYRIIVGMYKMLIDLDCSLIEINPLVITSKGDLTALDAKVEFDSNALYRQPKILEMRDVEQEDIFEYKASKYNLNYINLDNEGNIGSMVNGAGLAMATMDIIKRSGAKPANFLDVGGGANVEMIENGFKLILSNPNIKGIFINIFGGILRCDVLAQGVLKAAKKIKLNLPVIVRMEGTNVDQGRDLFLNSKLQFITAIDLKDAADQISRIFFS